MKVLKILSKCKSVKKQKTIKNAGVTNAEL
jgi:hypothetical protein